MEARVRHAKKEVWLEGKGEMGLEENRRKDRQRYVYKVQIIGFLYSALHSFPSFYGASQMAILMTLL